MPLLAFILLCFGPLLAVGVVAAGMWIPAYEAARGIAGDRPGYVRQTLKVLVNLLVAALLFAFLPFAFLLQRYPTAFVAPGAEEGALWTLGLLAASLFSMGVAVALLGSALLPHVAARPKDMLRAAGTAIVPLLVVLLGFLATFLWIAGAQYGDAAGPHGPAPWRAVTFMVAVALLLPAAVVSGRRITEADTPDWKRAALPLWGAFAVAAVAMLLVVQPLFF